VTKEHVAAAVRLPATIDKLAKELCRGELKGVGISAPAGPKTLRDLYEDYDAKELESIDRALSKNVAELEPSIMAKVGEIIAFLRGIFPRHTFATLAGQEQVDSGEYELLSFTAILDALDKPLTLFNGMSDGSILSSQVAAVRQFFPTLSEAFTEAVTETPLDLRAAKASFCLPWDTEIGINKWLGKPPIDPELAKMLMDVQAASPLNVAPPPPTPPKANPEPQVRGALSEADRTQYADASGKVP
jgi:hypothetical protein